MFLEMDYDMVHAAKEAAKKLDVEIVSWHDRGAHVIARMADTNKAVFVGEIGKQLSIYQDKIKWN